MKYVYVRFSSIVWFLQFLSYFLWVLEVRSKLILFYTKFWVEPDFWRLHVLVCCCAANQYTEITDIFLRFQTEEHILRVNKSKITGKNTFNGDHFEFEGNHGKVKTKKFCFGYFWWFVTSALTLRLWNTYMYVFQALFGFCNF